MKKSEPDPLICARCGAPYDYGTFAHDLCPGCGSLARAEREDERAENFDDTHTASGEPEATW